MSLLAGSLALLLLNPKDAEVVDLKDGFIRVKTSAYSLEVPKGWKVSPETPWGARKMVPTEGRGELGAMTAGPTRASWDDLYRTSLYFIQREEQGKPTPYTVSKTAQGYEAASFTVLDKEGFAARRYVLLKDKNGRVLALNVRIPGRQAEPKLVPIFERMVRTARMESANRSG